MQLTYYRGVPGNFGDELNASMWSELLPPGLLNDDSSELFLGIGSILWDNLPQTSRKFVAGSGWGGYSPPPDMHNGSWEVLWVRGPRTSAKLGLDPALAIADAAVLIRRTTLPKPGLSNGVAFMPHMESLDRGDWAEVCRLAGVTFLDPGAPVPDLLAKIRSARLVVTEAMHGAIVADALRTPWIGVRPFHALHRPKWLDWSESLEIDLRFVCLLPSSLRELFTLATGRTGRGARSLMLFDNPPSAPFNLAMRHIAAKNLLRVIERTEPQLSRDDRLETATSRCEEALYRFVQRRQLAR